MAHEHAQRLYEQIIRPSDHLKIAGGLGVNFDENTRFLIEGENA